MEALSLNLRLLTLSGIVEPTSVSGSLWKRSLFSMYMTTSIIVFMPILLGELMAFYHFWGDLVVITNNMFTLVGNVTFYGEALYIIARKKDFLKLVEKLQDMIDHMPRAGAKGDLIAKQTAKRSKSLTLSMLFIVYMVPFSWSISPLVTMLLAVDEDIPEHETQLEDEVEEFWKSLISIMWLPLDATQSPAREIIYMGQAFVFLITASYYTSVNTVFVALIVQTTGQFEILLATINHMDDAVRSQDLLPFEKTEDLTMDVSAGKVMRWMHRHDDPTELRPYFVAVIRHHQMVIAKGNNFLRLWTTFPPFMRFIIFVSLIIPLRFATQCFLSEKIGFAKQLNDVLSPLLFFYFFSAQVMMCVMAFQMVLTWEEQNNFLKFCFGLLCVLVGPFYFCSQGDVLIQKSFEVQEAVYGCKWYYRSERFKRTMLQVITRSQIPVSLTAGKLYIVSMESFAKMLNTVYYYFAVLKQLHEK